MRKSIPKKRSERIRSKLKRVNFDRFRLSVHKSSQNISAQIIDDKNNKTLVSASSLNEKNTGKKKSDVVTNIAGLLAKKALEKKITRVFFDRGRFKYHGQIKLFAEALRKNGLNF